MGGGGGGGCSGSHVCILFFIGVFVLHKKLHFKGFRRVSIRVYSRMAYQKVSSEIPIPLSPWRSGQGRRT